MIDYLKRNYTKLIQAASSLESVFLLAVRLFWGYLFLQAGLGKMHNLSSISDYFYSLGIPFPELNAHLVAWIEAIGGGCLIIGFASRLVSIPLIFTMLVAFFTAHLDALKNVIEDPSSLLQVSPFTFLLAALIIFIFGPGKFSVDQIIESLTKSKTK